MFLGASVVDEHSACPCLETDQRMAIASGDQNHQVLDGPSLLGSAMFSFSGSLSQSSASRQVPGPESLPCFEDWRFPRRKLPPPWRDLRIPPFEHTLPNQKGKQAASTRSNMPCYRLQQRAGFGTHHLGRGNLLVWLQYYGQIPVQGVPVGARRQRAQPYRAPQSATHTARLMLGSST
ncbi:hypothetical protein MAPG_10450 [Magnaporthiopsis poae ATCC 64411]|uniref:Uncharacterized protein n=1 Tax=Magnaporthiopsis poae (strain ATCC 64411 / 73-15) TaxID=644358 RepID=A0A0C4ECL9_MAGP6|nr:hypothetical protein MAPG_10450 [Magnaporthiopsis poae ATCC 64411]